MKTKAKSKIKPKTLARRVSDLECDSYMLTSDLADLLKRVASMFNDLSQALIISNAAKGLPDGDE